MPTFSDAMPPTWGFTPDERARARAEIEELKRIRAERAALDAREARAHARLMGIALDQMRRMPTASDYAFPVRSMAAEAALAVKESPRAMQARLDQAYDLVERFPATTAALAEGRITQRHAREIVDAGSRIDDNALRAMFEADIVPVASRSTPARTKTRAVVAAERHDPEPIDARHHRARADRGVSVVGLPDGMAELRILTTAVRARAIHDRLTAQAKHIKRDNRTVKKTLDDTDLPMIGLTPEQLKATDDRHVGQLRADLAADLLLTAEPTGHDVETGIAATVEITIPVTTLLGLDDGAALLDGDGPIDPGTARRLAAGSIGWERVFLNPDTGALLTVDRYTPTAAQRRFLHARDKTCRVPGCATKAKHTDSDHTIPYSQGGPTSVHNLECLCEAHHMMKHHAPWGFQNLGQGRIRLTSPCGYDYVESPPIIYSGAEPPAPF